MRIVLVGLLSVAALPGVAASALAKPPELRRAVESLLTVGAKPSQAALTKSRETYEAAKHLAPHDARLDYALALVLVRQRQFDEALKQFDDIATHHKGQMRLAAREARIWLLLLREQYPAAAAEFSLVAEQFPEVDDSSATLLQAPARRVGVLFGYLSDVRHGSLSATELVSIHDQLSERLGASLQPAFEEGIDQVKQTHADLLVDLEAARVRETQTAQQHIETEKQKIEGDKQDIGEQQAKIQADAEVQAKLFREELNQLESAWNKVGPAYQAVIGQVAGLEGQIGNLSAQRALCYRIVQDKDGKQQQELFDPGRLAIIDGTINQLSAQLFPLQARLNQLSAEGQTLLNQRQQLLARNNQAANYRQWKEFGLDAKGKRLTKRGHELEKPAAPKASSMLRRKTELIALRSYQEFPFDDEAARVLKSFHAE